MGIIWKRYSKVGINWSRAHPPEEPLSHYLIPSEYDQAGEGEGEGYTLTLITPTGMVNQQQLLVEGEDVRIGFQVYDM